MVGRDVGQACCRGCAGQMGRMRTTAVELRLYEDAWRRGMDTARHDEVYPLVSASIVTARPCQTKPERVDHGGGKVWTVAPKIGLHGTGRGSGLSGTIYNKYFGQQRINAPRVWNSSCVRYNVCIQYAMKRTKERRIFQLISRAGMDLGNVSTTVVRSLKPRRCSM